MTSRNIFSKINLRQDARSGFTLIEVLVVVAIIALLMAILLPSLSRIRQQAHSARCKAYVRQLGTGMMMYLQDYGAFPAHQWRPDSVERIRWFNAMAKEMNGLDVQSCPSTPDWEVGRNNSYGYNYKYLGSGRYNDISPTSPWERFPVKGVRAPATTIAFGDTDGTGWTKPHVNGIKDKDMFGNHGYTLDPTYIPKFSEQTRSGHAEQNPEDRKFEPYAWSDGSGNWYRTVISERHLGESNFCFADGHVEELHPKEVYRDNRLWNGLGGEDPTRDDHVTYKRQAGEVRWPDIGV